MTFHLAGRRASLGLAAYLGRGIKMPRLCFYNQRFASRAPGVDITSGDCPSSVVGNPPAFDFEIDFRCSKGVAALRPVLDAGPPRGHPASSGCMLDGTRAGFGPIDVRMDAFASCGELRCFFGSPDALSTATSGNLIRNRCLLLAPRCCVGRSGTCSRMGIRFARSSRPPHHRGCSRRKHGLLTIGCETGEPVSFPIA